MKVFLDLDGPVLDVSRRYYKVFSDISKQKNIKQKEFWKYKREKKSWNYIFNKVKIKLDEDKFLKVWLKNIEKRNYLKLDKIQFRAKGVLHQLLKNNTLYLISLRQSKSNLLWELKHLKLDRYFDKIIYCKHSKNLGGLEKARLIKKNLSKKEKAIIAGDTEIDIRAAKLAKIKSIGINSGIRTKELLVKEKPDFICNKLEEIVKFVS